MSNYKLARYSQDKYRFQIYDNASRLSWQKIKAQTGCYALINLTYFNLTTFKADDALMVDGKWVCPPPWRYNGLLVDKDGALAVGPDSAAVWGYANGEPVYRLNGSDQKAEHFGANGSTFVGMEADGTVVLLLAPKDKPITSREGVAALGGCRDILRFDGSWSTQGSLGPGLDVDPSQERIVRSYLLVFEREKKEEEDKPVKKKIVCIDPGHGPGCPNGAPDGTYKEDEFAQYMGYEVQRHLERCGVAVVMTRGGDEFPSLTYRAEVSNEYMADLLVSLHSNAPNSKDLDKNGWCESARGLLVYTSAAGDTAGRNKAAKAVLARMKEAGVALSGSGLLHEKWTVLVKAAAPAILIEYGFHTSRGDVALLKDHAYRGKLAEATAKGVCDYLGVAWVEEPAPAPGVPWYAEDQKWAVDNSISDGTRPEEKITRAEVWAMLRRVFNMIMQAIKAGK